MIRLYSAVVVCLLAGQPAFAQFTPPPVLNPIPAPLPPPAPPPIINGPLGQNPPPGVYVPPALRTHSDRTIQCQHEGSSYGLRGRKLQAYTRSCANAN
jgi:hypothetical protein